MNTTSKYSLSYLKHSFGIEDEEVYEAHKAYYERLQDNYKQSIISSKVDRFDGGDNE